KLHIVYNGIDLSRFTRQPGARHKIATEYQIDDDEIILLTVASMFPVKRIDVLLRACNLLKERGVRFRFIVAGKRTELEKDLRSLAAELNLGEQVHWHGPTTTPEELMSAADIFLLASHGEAFGNVVVEAMSCGAPVVGSRSGGIQEIIEDGISGLLANVDDPNDFATKIERLSRDVDLRRRCAD